MTPSEDPIDIFDRLEFPEEPAPLAPTSADEQDGATDAAAPDKPRRLWLFALIGVAIGLVIAWVIFNQGQPSQLPADHPQTDAAVTATPISPEELAQLKANVEADPANTDNRLVYGVALFNEGQYDLAEEQWIEVTRLDPTDAGPWYNLGFLYLSLDPPAADKAEAAWTRVVELVPGTNMADTASQHLGRLNSTARPEVSASPSP